jgi:hypothetical protein
MTDPEWRKKDVFAELRKLYPKPEKMPDRATVQRMMREMGEKLLTSPLARRYMARANALGDPGSRIHSPSDVFGEREARVGSILLLYAHGEELGVHSMPFDRVFPMAIRAMMASPYLWTDVCYKTARAMEVPEHRLSPALLSEARMWWTFETGWDFAATDDESGGSFDAWLLSDEGDGFSLYIFGQDDAGRPEVREFGYQYGMPFPSGIPEAHRATSTSPIAMASFLNSPYIPKRVDRMDRAGRRASVRHYGEEHDDDHVTFVDLRRIKTRQPGEGEESISIDWKHRWVVSGHLRAQWYPSENAHHLIYIAPYMKGPEDAPLLEHTYRVKR